MKSFKTSFPGPLAWPLGVEVGILLDEEQFPPHERNSPNLESKDPGKEIV